MNCKKCLKDTWQNPDTFSPIISIMISIIFCILLGCGISETIEFKKYSPDASTITILFLVFPVVFSLISTLCYIFLFKAKKKWSTIVLIIEKFVTMIIFIILTIMTAIALDQWITSVWSEEAIANRKEEELKVCFFI